MLIHRAEIYSKNINSQGIPCLLLLEQAGSDLSHICRIQVFITDRTYRDAVYQAFDKWLKGVYPVSTGLILSGLARPEWVMEVEATAFIPSEYKAGTQK